MLLCLPPLPPPALTRQGYQGRPCVRPRPRPPPLTLSPYPPLHSGKDIKAVPASGPAPAILRFEDWLTIVPDYERLTTVMEADPVMTKKLGGSLVGVEKAGSRGCTSYPNQCPSFLLSLPSEIA